MDDLPKIFTRINLDILDLLEQDNHHIREIADRLGCSPAKVHSCVGLFKKHNLVKEVKEKNRKVISLNRDSVLLKRIREMRSTDAKDSEPHFMDTIGLFDTLSPFDFRYYSRSEKTFQALKPYLSEAGFISYAAKTEAALTKTLAKMRLCPQAVAKEVEQASKRVTAEEVYKEEDRIKHNIRALANAIRDKVSEEAKPYVHFTTTSHDIICTSDAARYKDFTEKALVPKLVELERTLISLALREKDTVQIGRTHGQHAEPITFGFAIAQYVSRLGHTILAIKRSGSDLRGKIAGAVGAYNASGLFFKDPEAFEAAVLKEMGLKPSPISTQVVEAEYMTYWVNAMISCLGVLANLSDDMRHLQRSEIAEIGEAFGEKQVGSSTMPHKRNPINFENVKSMWKAMMPRMMTMYQDQLSEHQRDLTNSASMRFIPEIAAGLYVSAERLDRTMAKLVVDTGNMKRNFDQNKDFIAAEPLYILLAAHGHEDAHEYVREKTLEAQGTGKTLRELVSKDKSIQPFLKRFTKAQKALIMDPALYTGIAAKKTQKICAHWKRQFPKR